MRLSVFLVVALGALSGCGPKMMTVDAGPDTSCGLDCAAQTRYGLLLDNCFEYSTDNGTTNTPPSLGMWVQRQPMTSDGLFELEGGVKSLVVEYRQGGQTVGTDYLGIKNGDLYLYRRIAGGQSVTFKTEQAITGVKWLSMSTASGENYSTSTTAFLSRDNSSTATVYRITTDVPTGAEKKTPLMTYDTAIKVLFGEMPDHGADPRRIYVPDVGFTVIASPFNLLGGSPTPHYLQKIRQVTVGGAGDPCSLGTP
ncbi:MAG: hypothetical protein JNM17_14520 [Archangium sp.]|nr:hypothetical protein [Archangium sp.]